MLWSGPTGSYHLHGTRHPIPGSLTSSTRPRLLGYFPKCHQSPPITPSLQESVASHGVLNAICTRLVNPKTRPREPRSLTHVIWCRIISRSRGGLQIVHTVWILLGFLPRRYWIICVLIMEMRKLMIMMAMFKNGRILVSSMKRHSVMKWGSLKKTKWDKAWLYCWFILLLWILVWHKVRNLFEEH